MTAVRVSWHEANSRYLESELARLRLLVLRRALWQEARPRRGEPGLPGGAELFGLEERRFYETAPGVAPLNQALHEIHARIMVQIEEMTHAGQQTALAAMVQLFNLSPFACDVLLLCLAPDLDPAFQRLYAEAQGDPALAYPTPHLAFGLFGGDAVETIARREDLASHAALRRYQLIVLDVERAGTGPVHAAPLRLPERTLDYLTGTNRCDERVATWLHDVPPGAVTPEERERIARLRAVLRGPRGEGDWPLINVIGRTAATRRVLARAAATALELDLYELDPGWLLAPGGQGEGALCLLEREALLSQRALFLDRGGEGADEAQERAIDAAITRLRLVLFVGSQEQLHPERSLVPLEEAGRDTAAKLGFWRAALAGVDHAVDGGLGSIVEQFDFDPYSVTRIVRAAEARARMRTDGEHRLSHDDLWSACCEHAGTRLSDTARSMELCHGWDDIVLPDPILRQLHDIAAQVENRAQVYTGWGFATKLGRGRGISVLFAGASGTGKTMAAEVLAGHLRLRLYRIDLAGVVSKYIGETEKNLRRVFDAAEQSGTILLFDEADALFGKRSEVKDSHDRYANIEVNYLLQRMEDYRGLAILATNMKGHIDEAFLRRLRFVIDFPAPDAAARVLIWKKAFPPAAAVEPLDYAALGRLDVPGGNIKNIALNAAFLAAQEARSISLEHIFRAARVEYAKIEKIVVESDFRPSG